MSKLSSINNVASLVKVINHKLYIKRYAPITIDFLKKNTHKYVDRNIPKKRGGFRTLNIPNDQLLHVQEILLELFYESQDRNVRENKWISQIDRSAPAYKPSNYYLNKPAHWIHAKNHVNKAIIVSFDFHDFFGSLYSGRIYSVFIKYFKCSKSVATILTNLTTFNHSLPQGAPTSPFLSNLVMYYFDKTMIKISRENSVRYSRYADDVILSSNNRQFLNNTNFFQKSFNNGQNIEFSEQISKLLLGYHLSLNPNKTRVYNYWNQQKITGIVVNHHTNISRRKLVVHRSILINLIKAIDMIAFDNMKGYEQLQININKALSVLKINDNFLNELDSSFGKKTKMILKLKLIHFILFSKTKYYLQVIDRKSKRIEKIMLLSNRLNLLLNNIMNDNHINPNLIDSKISNKTGLSNNCTFYFTD
ncbi:reverse transcriptase family protein (plasmid) [Leuconostoc mesenteroides]|uniref:reverse transcriptase family protein n=1 Tax=Leuconostoc mesenteroides TaxID=1245 RepID=UPI0021E59BDA|nr:reverse transcriptase family protein [Leuconostoc mesenteroides]MCV2530852.1 reverse transcriptase family protein [Leuconostoc mesenteroides]WVI91311.1 reverse transcriptase family protein [Leuconostoc mesenteroides]